MGGAGTRGGAAAGREGGAGAGRGITGRGCGGLREAALQGVFAHTGGGRAFTLRQQKHTKKKKLSGLIRLGRMKKYPPRQRAPQGKLRPNILILTLPLYPFTLFIFLSRKQAVCVLGFGGCGFCGRQRETAAPNEARYAAGSRQYRPGRKYIFLMKPQEAAFPCSPGFFPHRDQDGSGAGVNIGVLLANTAGADHTAPRVPRAEGEAWSSEGDYCRAVFMARASSPIQQG